MNGQFERQLEKSLNKDIEIPKSVLEKKELAFQEIRKKQKRKFSYKKLVGAAMALVIITGASITIGMHGESALAMVKEVLFAKDKGIQKAVDNGYVQEIEKNNVMKDNGVEIQVQNVLYDKSKIAVSLKMKFEDESLIHNVTKIMMNYDLIDDKGRYIVKESTAEGLTEENSEILAGGDWSMQLNEEEGEVIYNIMYYPMNPIDEIKSLHFNIRSIQLFTPLKNNDASFITEEEAKRNEDKENIEVWRQEGLQLNKKIDGNWKGSLTLAEKFKQNLEIQYIPKEQLESVKISSVELLPTGMNITFEHEHSEDKGQLKKQIDTVNSAQVVDNNGKVYESTLKGYSSVRENGSLFKIKTFDITSFDDVGDLKIVLKDVDGSDVTIDLVREEKK